MRKRINGIVAIVMALALVAAACGDDDEPDVEGLAFTLFGAPTGAEADAMQGFLDVYNRENGTDINFQGSPDFEVELRIQVEGGNPPTVAFVPQPGSICEFADDGHLVSLEEMGFDIAEMQENHGQFWMDLGLCSDGQHYGIPWFPNFKSIVFYNTAVFDAEGYQTPDTWEEMIALSEQMVADGYTPWCMGFGSGDATGWPGTDWIEDIMVRMHGGDVYDQWWKHEIPFNDPRVVAAFDKFGEIMFGEGFVIGGAANVAGITFQDSPLPMFADPPGCVMLKQGSFIANFFPEDVTEDDWDVFPFPTIDGNTGAMGGGDTIIVFDAQEGIPAVIQDWISPDWQCVLASASGGTASQYGGHGVAGIERLPGHKDVDPNCYESSSAQAFATAITDALADNAFVFDASDLMPPAVGQGSFWEGMVNWTRGTSSQQVADTIEASWP